MGGMNSGRGRRPNRRGRKPMKNYLPGLDVPDLLRKFRENPTTYCILNGNITLTVEESCIKPNRVEGNPLFTQKIDIASMPCNYGGFRYFGVCPFCQKRVSTLYFVEDCFGCRTCFKLCYRSQNATLSDRLYKKEKAIEKKLGGCSYERPKWMRKNTFERLREEFYLAENREQVANFFSFRNIQQVDQFIEEHGGLML